MLSIHRPLARIGPTLSRLVSTETHLTTILGKEKDVPKSSDVDKPATGTSTSTSRGNFQTAFRPFRNGRHVSPYNLTYQSRAQTPPIRKRRPTLGPGASESKYRDLFHQLNTDPLEHCLNSSLLSYFVSEMGRIHPRSNTGLTRQNQRKVGKAIRRAKMMGIMPVFSKRPLQATGNFKPAQ
ncbi:hypothetical protein BDV98DRAFT_579995 [Pterulicium gracile]|uniref:Small ribosomal subunit protein bS18m n=1 Tax=Pterulicium gracile TaxID=1884261 RepID=A0A5C3QVA0_9AGAR|nr:hypothetical protein BDV98DRAFT_579995 [Pterula gracilis]